MPPPPPPTPNRQGVELLEEGSGGRGGADLKTAMTTVAEFEFDSGNGGMFAAPLAGGNAVDSAKTSEENEAFLMGGADTKRQQQHHHPPGWMKAFMNFFNKLSGRKLLLMAKTSARGLIDRGPTIKDVEEVFAHVTDTTATLAVGFFSLRFGGKTPALVATLVMLAATRSVVSAASTSGLSGAGMTSADMGSSGTCEPGNTTDWATLIVFLLILNVIVMISATLGMRTCLQWVLATVVEWTRRMGRIRGGGASA
ncbi:unnamed protein product, partial [Ectocarpus fasciculatus]